MNLYRICPPPRWWMPQLSPRLVQWARPIRQRMRIRDQQLVEVNARGLEHLRAAMQRDCGILITPNHSSHADPFAMYAAADEIPSPLFFMATWQVFASQKRWGQWALQRHGIFSVDREGTDLQAFRESVRILQQERFPLVIFPEGEIYHCNDRVTPFRDGPATIAISAARRSDRQVLAIPAALKYEYLNDPRPQLETVMDALEKQIHWRPRANDPLPSRLYAFAEAMLGLKELEYTGRIAAGSLPERISHLTKHILQGLAARYDVHQDGATVPEQIKALRRCVIAKLYGPTENAAEPNSSSDSLQQDVAKLERYDQDLEDLFFVGQLYSYPGDYVAERPTVERLAETFDKFEEDVLHRPTATIRGPRRVTIYFDEPIEIGVKKRSKAAVADLTALLEARVQSMLDAHPLA